MSLIRIFWEFLLVLLTSAQPSSLKNMLLLNNSCPVWKRLEQLTLLWPLHSFVSVEVSVNLSIWLALHLLCIPQRPFSYLMRDVRKCFAQCTAVDTSDHAWHQPRLSLSRGGLGLCSLAQHSPAAYIATLYLGFWLPVSTSPCLSNSNV